jgi:hypothetical protein
MVSRTTRGEASANALLGILDGLVGTDAAALTDIAGWLAGTPFSAALDEVAQAEAVVERAKADLGRPKKRLGSVMLNGS